jgi:hypothetical protein
MPPDSTSSCFATALRAFAQGAGRIYGPEAVGSGHVAVAQAGVSSRARSGLAESRRFPKRRESDSTCWLGLEASLHGASLFFGPARAGGCSGGFGPVVPRGGQDVHGQRRQRREVVAAPARPRQSGGAEDGRAQALSCGAGEGLGSFADRREARSHAANFAQGAGRSRPSGQLLRALAFSAPRRRDVQKKPSRLRTGPSGRRQAA